LVGQGLAGTIDMRTVRPLDYGKQAIVLNLRGEQNSNDDLGADSDTDGYRASFSYIDQFMDGKLGLAIGYAHLDSPLATRGFGTYEPWNAAGSSGGVASCGNGSPNNCTANPGVAAGNYVTNGMKVRADMGSTERDGLMASVQFTPSDFYETTVDDYYVARWTRPTTRAASKSTSAATRRRAANAERKMFPHGLVFRLFGHDHQAGHVVGRHREHGDAARAQLPVHDEGRDQGRRVAQRDSSWRRPGR
jgi:hypothetical protein